MTDTAHRHGKYLFLDLETTGLDTQRAAILQISATVCDWAFEPIEGRSLTKWVLNDPESFEFERGALALHVKTGLLDQYLDAVKAYDPASSTRGDMVSVGLAEIDLLEIMAPTAPTSSEKLILAGNDVESFDRKFLARFMPTVDKRLHYRTLNVTSLREAYASAAGITTGAAVPARLRAHFADSDVAAAIDEAKRIRALIAKGLA